MSILVVGSVAYDSIKTPYGEVDKALGGSALYFSSAATHFSPVSVVGVVGKDFDTKDVAFLKQRGADLSGLEKKEGKTFHWRGEYAGSMNEAKTLSTCLNVFESFSPKLSPSYQNSKYVFLGNIDPDLQLDVLNQVKKKKIIAIDTMNLWIDTKNSSLSKLIKKVDIVIMNDKEALTYTSENNVILAAKALVSAGPSVVIIKKGEHGAYMRYGDKQFVLPAYPLAKVVDPTGAGDSFAGGFMGYLSSCGKISEVNLKKAVLYGTVMASFNVESFSMDRLRKLKKPEIEKRVKAFKKNISL